MIAAGTLVAAVSCWSLFAAAARQGSDARSMHFDGDLVRRYRTSASAGGHCCTGQSQSTAATDETAISGEVINN